MYGVVFPLALDIIGIKVRQCGTESEGKMIAGDSPSVKLNGRTSTAR